MPRKKNVSVAPEEPLTENQEVQAVPAESGEMEGGGFPLEAETAALPPETENAAPPSETEAGGFPLEAGTEGFPSGEDPCPHGGAVPQPKCPPRAGLRSGSGC